MVNWYLLLVQVAVWVKKLFGALCCFWEGCVFCHSAALLQNLKDLPSFSPAADHLVAWNYLCLVRKYTKENAFCQFLIQWVSDYMDTWITHEQRFNHSLCDCREAWLPSAFWQQEKLPHNLAQLLQDLWKPLAVHESHTHMHTHTSWG